MEQTERITTEVKAKSNLQAVTEAGRKGLETTGRITTKVLDFADKIDRWFDLHGGKLKWFISLSLVVVVFAPIIDWLRNDWRDRLTFYTTAFLFIFIFFMALAWIASLRDDEGHWSFQRVRSRIWTYLQISYDYIMDSFSKPMEDMLYRLSVILIVGSFCCKAIQNVSVFFRKVLLMEKALGRLDWLRSYERTTNTWAMWIFFLGLALLIYLCYTSKKIRVAFLKNYLPFLLSTDNVIINNTPTQLSSPSLVIDAKNPEQVSALLKGENPELYNEFILALQKWNPTDCYSEDDFENKLHRHLKRYIANSSVQRQYRIIVDEADARKDNKADIVINDTILIEIKKDEVSKSTTYVYDQVWKYADKWKDRGPVILLFCKGDYNNVKEKYTARLIDLEKVDKRVVAFVATPR